ncbi:MAG: hypothetical protein IKJ13_03770 [Clostridia bacterium]|nr:hypothetical protein [Clostridia bacterium]
MNEYMISLFAVSSVLPLLSLISYKSRLDGVRKFAFGILLFSVASSPFINALSELISGDFSDIVPPEDITDGDSEQIFEEAFSQGIKTSVCEKFGLKAGEVRVLIVGFVPEKWRAEKIRVILSGTAALSDYHEIERYINNMEIGECETEIEIG